MRHFILFPKSAKNALHEDVKRNFWVDGERKILAEIIRLFLFRMFL
jgi:hypothetical protein